MQISPYLVFNGTCRQAMTWYAEVLGGTIEAMMPVQGSPAEEHMVGAGGGELILHACIQVDGQMIMASDAPAGRYEQPAGTYVSLVFGTADESRRIFDLLADGGSVTMPFDRTFWSEGFGMVVDRFGTPWMVNTSTPK